MRWAEWEPYLADMGNLRSLRVEFDCQLLSPQLVSSASVPSGTPIQSADPSATPRSYSYPLPGSYDKQRSSTPIASSSSSSSSTSASSNVPNSSRGSQHQGSRPLRFNIPSDRCIEAWTSDDCCQTLDRLYIGVFGGDALIDWTR